MLVSLLCVLFDVAEDLEYILQRLFLYRRVARALQDVDIVGEQSYVSDRETVQNRRRVEGFEFSFGCGEVAILRRALMRSKLFVFVERAQHRCELVLAVEHTVEFVFFEIGAHEHGDIIDIEVVERGDLCGERRRDGRRQSLCLCRDRAIFGDGAVKIDAAVNAVPRAL